ncbi:MAG: hypothetical protein AAF658_11580, partial [Myxococcota bacterium]
PVPRDPGSFKSDRVGSVPTSEVVPAGGVRLEIGLIGSTDKLLENRLFELGAPLRVRIGVIESLEILVGGSVASVYERRPEGDEFSRAPPERWNSESYGSAEAGAKLRVYHDPAHLGIALRARSLASSSRPTLGLTQESSIILSTEVIASWWGAGPLRASLVVGSDTPLVDRDVQSDTLTFGGRVALEPETLEGLGVFLFSRGLFELVRPAGLERDRAVVAGLGGTWRLNDTFMLDFAALTSILREGDRRDQPLLTAPRAEARLGMTVSW